MMQKKPSSSSKQISNRAWNLLRIALLWARKGGVFKNNRLIFDHFRTLPKFIKNLCAHNHHQDQQWNALHYGERQLSFDDTPLIHVKMHRPSSLRFKIPNIPCINAPPVDFDYNFDQDYEDQMYNNNENVVARKSFLKGAEGEEEEEEEEEEEDESCDHGEIKEGSSECCDEGIDRKAEEFIANFYKQMKLQRQISYLQYHEKINGGAN